MSRNKTNIQINKAIEPTTPSVIRKLGETEKAILSLTTLLGGRIDRITIRSQTTLSTDQYKSALRRLVQRGYLHQDKRKPGTYITTQNILLEPNLQRIYTRYILGGSGSVVVVRGFDNVKLRGGGVFRELVGLDKVLGLIEEGLLSYAEVRDIVVPREVVEEAGARRMRIKWRPMWGSLMIYSNERKDRLYGVLGIAVEHRPPEHTYQHLNLGNEGIDHVFDNAFLDKLRAFLALFSDLVAEIAMRTRMNRRDIHRIICRLLEPINSQLMFLDDISISDT